MDAISRAMIKPAVFAQLAMYNQIDRSGSRDKILQDLIVAKRLILAGVIQAVCEGQVITLGCCCGLENWCEWQNFLESGETPWLGHDPSPWLERIGDVVRI
jgi:hypothetical protein